MRIRIRLLNIIIAISASVLLLGAARFAGRSIPAKLAVVQVSELRTDVVTYGLIDLDRRFFTQRSINVPGFAGSNFNHFPPLVLQSSPNEDTTTWTLNALDVLTGTFTPEMRIETSPGDRLNAAMFRQEADDRWIYHDFTQAKLYYTRPGELEAQFAQAAPIGSTFWSNDLTRFAVEAAGTISITDAGTGETDIVMQNAGPQAAVRWSPDDRYIAVSSRLTNASTGHVIDVESLEAVVTFTFKGYGMRWCGDQPIYSADTGAGIFEVRLYDLTTGTENVLLTRDLSDIPVPRRTFAAAGLSGLPCDWLLVFTGNSEAELVHVASGKTIPFGGNLIRPLNVVDGAVTYLVEEPPHTELRRIVLDPATEGYKVLASLNLLSTSLTWIDEGRGAVYLRNGQLRRIDPDSGKEILLPGAEFQTFYVMP
jgi:hypothetical protein